MAKEKPPMEIAFLVYDGMTALDLIGPYEVLNGLPGAELRFVAKKPGALRVDSKAFGIVVDHALADVPRPDVIVVPGGVEGTFAAARDEEILGWVRGVHEHTRFTTSVCTGSLILGAAGVLAGRKATTHWAAVKMLAQSGCSYSPARVVVDGKVITAAGVSSGIDMGLRLAALLADEQTARTLQLILEYDPEPPFDAGSPAKAGEEIVGRAMATFAGSL
jgi:transcriptional regulator GlxA family with amidase domain